jgi:hypothetical protein
MVFTLVAVLVGFAVAFALGGKVRHLADRGFRWWLLLPIGLVLQWLLEREGAPWPFGLLLVSYACLIGFGVANLRVVGMWMVTVGFALNALVIATNHGMPVSNDSLRALKVKGRITEVKHHAERSSDKLLFLADIIPVPPIGQVLSFGDMILSVGIVDVLVHLMRPRRRLHDVDGPTEDWPTEPWQQDGKRAYKVSSAGVVDVALAEEVGVSVSS